MVNVVEAQVCVTLTAKGDVGAGQLLQDEGSMWAGGLGTPGRSN